MPDILLIVILGISLVLSIIFGCFYLDDRNMNIQITPPSLPIISIIILICCTAWFTYSISFPIEYIKAVDGQIAYTTINHQTTCTLIYADLNNRITTRHIDYISPSAKVKVHIPRLMYFGVLYTHPDIISPKIEVIENVEVQSSEHETPKAIESQRVTGLLNE